MNDRQPRRAAVRVAGPSLAEFREHLLDTAPQSPALENFMLRAVVKVIDSYSADHAAVEAPRSSVPGGDTLGRMNLQPLARTYRNAQRSQSGRLDPLLDKLAADFELADIRTLRLAAEAAVAATPRAIKAARARGMKAPQIADELGLTPSRVYQVLRELDADK
ncbi:hypothetical protein [Streptomyces montanisoli]|uniref:Uncharacterized protein n=1 Tax=Streptomyces montanisoli TaxID=2798581 RepID=A0A940M8B7_9ACTN|nr:hypothetical protein [Streptomyces montanisoli]MBP0456238.1 hypothetical protein [Streptomyces montanisoli]